MDATSLPFSPAAERNRGPILAALQALLPARARVLEIAAGTGQHAAHFAAAQPGWRWLPTEADERLHGTIAARSAALAQVEPPQRLDVRHWPAGGAVGAASAFDAVYCANLLHISPWATTPALMAGAAWVLRPGGLLVVYGPFLRGDGTDAPSNLAFDADLRARDPAWGVRLLRQVLAEAGAAGLQALPPQEMPANNLLLAWRRPGAGDLSG
ncbi:MAG: DUF938 domain-containing protein [Burkholderiales bacterium]|nr:DUF938 domain-containing protein [Burkholderiales bacterium]